MNLAGERESPRTIIKRKLTSNDEDIINEQLKQAGLLMGKTTTFHPRLQYSSFPWPFLPSSILNANVN